MELFYQADGSLGADLVELVDNIITHANPTSISLCGFLQLVGLLHSD
jgi:hypothetical protein